MAYVTIDEVRALKDMQDEGKYPDADVAAAIAWFETRFENHVGVAFAPRTASEWADGTGCAALWLDHWPVIDVTAVKTYTAATVFTAYTVDELADIRASSAGELRRVGLGTFAGGEQNILVEYSHGFETVPDDIRDAALVAIREKLMEDFTGSRGNRQFSVATQDGIVRSSTPGDQRPFGIPAVDVVANDYRRRYRMPAMI